MHLIACSTKGHGCMLSVLLNRFPSTLLIRFVKRNVSASSMMLFLSLILMRWSTHLASKQVVPLSIFEVGAFLTFIQCSGVITSFDKHVSKDDNMRLSFKWSIIPQSVLVVCIFSPFNYIHLCIPHWSRAMFQKMMIWKCPSDTSLFLHCRQGSLEHGPFWNDIAPSMIWMCLFIDYLPLNIIVFSSLIHHLIIAS